MTNFVLSRSMPETLRKLFEDFFSENEDLYLFFLSEDLYLSLFF